MPQIADKAKELHAGDVRCAAGGAASGVLNHLRMAAMACRVAARTDLDRACALLIVEGEDAKRTFVNTLVSCLPRVLGRTIKWHTPGTADVSFDEAWLAQCFARLNAGDTDSFEFLLRSRVRPSDRRYVGFLIARTAEQIDQL